ncbi:insulinase family protein [Shewanella avicenniae]|uniref:Protease 3 n=1 Tax=Shewanella avicenniae TaxID=2814294 RepID=A0ABX7QVL8_9GAMM|nr:insulinase family protein [Shewanella avicenniae]QSX34965.1 insulinase family protein [Shewanella avicenniae]
MAPSSDIIISPNDTREYRFITLSNGIKTLLVSDMDATQAAASVAVNVGHFDDPVSRPGMAHFLEHMLFLGTEKYPDAGSFLEFINQHGGNNNAWTGTEHTNFFFAINAEVFEEAVDRFSQFFIAPLFNQELVDRERHAIESEFRLKQKDDIRRIYQVLKETVNPAHPFSKFSVGNLDTLAGEPAQLRTELLQFYQQHYSANLMALSLVGPYSLDELAAFAQDNFAPVQNKQLQKPYPDTPLFTKQQLGKLITIVPLKEQKRLTLSFGIPSIHTQYQQKPLTFISHIIGNEAEGSLLSWLKNQGYAVSLSAGGGIQGYNFKEYNITIQLTEKGLQNYHSVVSACFAFIKLIATHGMQAWRYDERANLLKLAFRYQEQTKPMDLASHLSMNLHHFTPQDAVWGDYVMQGFDEPLTQQMLDLMSPDNMRLQLVSTEFPTDLHADWYHTPYSVSDIPASTLAEWQAPTLPEGMDLPLPNPFIVDDSNARQEDNVSATPVIISEGAGFRIWHKKDDEFNVPKGHIYLSFDSESASKTARHAALTRLYVEMLLDHLAEFTYPAEVAGLSYNIYPHQGGITLHLAGYTGQQEKLLDVLIDNVTGFTLSEQRFHNIKLQLLRSWYNHQQSKPISQLFNSLTVTLQQRNYELHKMAELLEDCTLEELNQHVAEFFSEIYLEGLVYGDWLSNEAKQLSKKLRHILSLISKPTAESGRELVNLTNKGTLLRELNVAHQDSAIIVYYQSEQTSPEQMAIFSLLNHTMSSPFFHELRTEKQLGYMLGTGYLPLNRHPGIIFYVQSPVAGPLKLLEIIDQFIADFNYAVMQITNGQWEATKQGLINQVMEQDANMKTRSQRYWVSIGNKDYQFNQRETVVAQIEQLTRADLIKFMMQKMRTKTADRLVLFSTGEQHKQTGTLNSGTLIDDLKAFKHQSDNFEF